MVVQHVFRQSCSRDGEKSLRAHGLRGMCVAAVLSQLSCTAPRAELVVTDPDPSVKIPAIEKAVHEKNQTALPQLVKDLDSDDPAVRFYANHALEELSGLKFGYRYFDNDDRREPAAQKWRQWLADPSASNVVTKSGRVLPASTRAATGPTLND